MVFTCTDTHTSMNMYVLHTQHTCTDTHVYACTQTLSLWTKNLNDFFMRLLSCAHDSNGGAISLALKVKGWGARAKECGQLSNKAEQQRYGFSFRASRKKDGLPLSFSPMRLILK